MFVDLDNHREAPPATGPAFSGRPIAQEARLHGPALEPHGTDHLRVAGHEVDGLVAPLHLLAAPLDVKHDALDGALRREPHALAVGAGLDLEPEVRDGGERNELERLRPAGGVSGVPLHAAAEM